MKRYQKRACEMVHLSIYSLLCPSKRLAEGGRGTLARLVTLCSARVSALWTSYIAPFADTHSTISLRKPFSQDNEEGNYWCVQKLMILKCKFKFSNKSRVKLKGPRNAWLAYLYHDRLVVILRLFDRGIRSENRNFAERNK